jgi:hypothetical protein
LKGNGDQPTEEALSEVQPPQTEQAGES